MKTLHVYIFRELAGPIVLSALFLALVLLLGRLFDLAELLISAGAGPGTVAQILVITVTTLLSLMAPAAVLLGTLIAIGRLTAENEILAIRAGGISLARLFLPTLVAAGILSGALMGLNGYVLPRLYRQIDLMVYDLKFQLLTSIKPKQFYESLSPDDMSLSLYYQKQDVSLGQDSPYRVGMRGVNLRMIGTRGALLNTDKGGELDTATGEFKKVTPKRKKGRKSADEGIVEETRIFAESGAIEGDPKTRRLTMVLKNGTIMPIDRADPEASITLHFDQLVRDLSPSDDELEKPKKAQPRKLSSSELARELAAPPTGDGKFRKDGRFTDEWMRYAYKRNELFRRITLPLATLAFVLIAIPLAIDLRPRAKSYAFLLSFGLVGAYYIMWTMATSIGTTQDVGGFVAFAALMAPNLVIGGIGAWLLVRADRL